MLKDCKGENYERKFEIHVTSEGVKIQGNTLEILKGLAKLIVTLKKIGVADQTTIKTVVNLSLGIK